MKLDQSIVLVGLPGSGKTTVGNVLGQSLGVPFADLDHLLEKEEGCTIPELFEQKGEDYFRRRESELLKQVLSRPTPIVLATGGGAPCFFDNMAYIRQHSFSIYLSLPWPLLANRLALQPGQRPLLKGLSQTDYAAALEERFGWRISYYQQAKVQLGIKEDQSAEALAAGLVQMIKPQ